MFQAPYFGCERSAPRSLIAFSSSIVLQPKNLGDAAATNGECATAATFAVPTFGAAFGASLTLARRARLAARLVLVAVVFQAADVGFVFFVFFVLVLFDIEVEIGFRLR